MKKFIALLLVTAMLLPCTAQAAVLKSGDKNDDVVVLQILLYEKGYIKEKHVTGYYGDITKSAVRAFQKDHGVEADGVAGSETMALLTGSATGAESKPQSNSSQQTNTQANFTPVSASGAGYGVAAKLGDTNDLVKIVQDRLKELGYLVINQTTRYYGEMTLEAVIEFQQYNSIIPSGVVDDYTFGVLLSTDAKPYVKAASTAQTTQPQAYLPIAATDSTKASAVLGTALEQLGKPYKYNSRGPDSYDCSGLVYYCFLENGIKLPASSSKQSVYEGGTMLFSIADLQPGDLIFFNTGNSSAVINHSGIYLGNGEFIHASSGGRKVQINSIASGYYVDAFRWGMRIIQ